MSHFNISFDDFFSDDDTMANKILDDQQVDWVGALGPRGVPKTTRLQNTGLDPLSTTLFDVSDIIQDVPSYDSLATVLGRNEDVLAKDVVPNVNVLYKPDPKGNDPAYLPILRALTPGDIGFNKADGTAADGTAAGDPSVTDPNNPTTPTPYSDDRAALYQKIKEHQNIVLSANVKSDFDANKINSKCLYLVLFIADHNIPVYVSCAITGHATNVSGTTRRSQHPDGNAVDIKPPNKVGKNITGDPWVDQVFGLMDTLTRPTRPKQVGGPYVYKGTSTASRSDSSGTVWFTDSGHQNHVHLGVWT